MRALLVASLLSVAASQALADGIERAPLRGSKIYEGPAYPVDIGARGYPATRALPPPIAAAPAGPPPPEATFEFAARYWLSFGRLSKRLFDVPDSGSGMVSRLTFGGLTAQSGEVFGRVNHASGLLIKGYAGIGGLNKGTLNDEDFAPVTNPYSSTMSNQHDGHLHYATVDLGYTVWRTPQAGVSGFVGYNYLDEKASAFGCAQIATNPFICVPTITPDVLGITENAQFHSVRLGVAGELTLFECLRLTAEAAWVPFTNMRGADSHWLRIGSSLGDFVGPIPETGHGDGVQLEAALAYEATTNLSFGLGARYWRFDTKGLANFDVVGFAPQSQPLNFTTERFGVFVQGGYRL